MKSYRTSGLSFLVSAAIHATVLLTLWVLGPPPPLPLEPLIPVVLLEFREIAQIATGPLESGPLSAPGPQVEPPPVARSAPPAKPKPPKKIRPREAASEKRVKAPPEPLDRPSRNTAKHDEGSDGAGSITSQNAGSSNPGSQVAGVSGSGSGRGSGGVGGDSIVRANYASVLFAWLQRHKLYPRSALRRGIEGRPVVEIRVARNGRLLGHRLTETSRHPMLDEAALAMVERATPFPPMPGSYPGDSFVYQFRVDFEIAKR